MEFVVNLLINKLYDVFRYIWKIYVGMKRKNCVDYVIFLFWRILYFGGVMLYGGNGDWGDLGLKNWE